MTKNKIKSLLFSGILILLICFSNFVYADNFDVKTYNNTGKTDVAGYGFTIQILATGLDVVRTVAAGVAIIGLIVIGIKYLYSAPEGRASLKKSLILWVLGMLMLLIATDIIDAIAGVGEGLYQGG